MTYKVEQNGKVIDVVEYPTFIRFLDSGHIAFTDRGSAHGIIGSDGKTLYSFNSVARKDVIVATIKEITSDEFSKLFNLLNSDQEFETAEANLEDLKQAAIKNLSSVCKEKITAGFSVVLSDRKSYSFKLTTEDQLNLMSIENQLNSGVETFVYHATDQPCQFFTSKDMRKILDAFKCHTLYHTTYFNVAKQYIKSLTEREKINSFTYGTDVSSIVKSKALKQILKNKGGI